MNMPLHGKMNEQDLPHKSSQVLERRQILKTGAWAAPVIALSTAVPAAAASTNFFENTIPTASIRVYWPVINDENYGGMNAGPINFNTGQLFNDSPVGGYATYRIFYTGPQGEVELVPWRQVIVPPYSGNVYIPHSPGDLNGVPMMAGSANNPLAPGTYSLTVEVIGAQGKVSLHAGNDVVIP